MKREVLLHDGLFLARVFGIRVWGRIPQCLFGFGFDKWWRISGSARFLKWCRARGDGRHEVVCVPRLIVDLNGRIYWRTF